MPRIHPLPPERAPERASLLLDGVQRKLGMTPNLMRTLAHSPAVLEAYLAFNTALGGGALSAALREQIALAVSEANQCGYCLAAHSAIGKASGLSDEAIRDSRRGTSSDSREAAALAFARALLKTQGFVTDAHLDRVRRAGFGDAEIVEIVAGVAATIFTNYVNHVAETDVDFPPAPALVSDSAHDTPGR